jgi:signal transduction histidine kinase
LGEEGLATASPFDAALRDVLDALLAATRELDGAEGHDGVARKAVDLALRLTRSPSAVLAIGSRERGYRQLFSNPGERDPRRVSELVAAAGFGPPDDRHTRERPRGSAIGAELRAQGQVIGLLAVGRPNEYTQTERTALEVLAGQVSMALVAAGRSDDRARSVERVERAHEQAVQVLESVSSHAVKGENLTDFYGRLARTVGELVGAGRVLFWGLGDDNVLTPLPGGYRIDDTILARLKPTRCVPDGDDLASRVVFNDLIFRASRSDEPPEFEYVLEILGVSSAISVPWRAGEDRLGILAAYDSSRPGGFSREDTWVLQKAGLAAGLVTRVWSTQEDLRKSVERLTKVDGARQMLLKNMTRVVEKERKRFVSELHDDALQKLTGAELQLARVQPGVAVDATTLDNILGLLEKTESALRRLVFEVRPPALESPDGLAESIRERVGMLEGLGIEAQLELDLPEETSLEVRTLVFRQVAEAIGNVERHSKASGVKISIKSVDGGLLGIVHDNGQGFVVADRSNLPGHLGLLALRERALMAGGSYKIESEPGAGTHVEFWIPVDQ